MTAADFPVSLTEMLFRFYGPGAQRHYSQVSDVFSRRPYDQLFRSLLETDDFEDITDVNDEVSFSFAAPGWVVRLSMVGPYALVLEGPPSGPWLPTIESAEHSVSEGLRLIRQHGFQVLEREMLERVVPLWSDEISLYRALFVNDDWHPWRSQTVPSGPLQ